MSNQRRPHHSDPAETGRPRAESTHNSSRSDDNYVNATGNAVAANYITTVQNDYVCGFGVLIISTNANGQQTVYDYDPTTGLVCSVTKPNGGTTTFEYDSAGN